MAGDWWWLWTPLAASVLLCLMLIPLGAHVLARGMVFADIAIAQWAALGALISGQIGHHWLDVDLLPGLTLAGLVCALAAALIVHVMSQSSTRNREAMIGTLYVVGASLATLAVSHDPHGAQALAQSQNGDLLWTTTERLLPLALTALAVLVWLRLDKTRQSLLFLPLFAVAVTLAVSAAGIYVVFSTLIATPLCLRCSDQRGLLAALLAGLAGHACGLLASESFDVPAGPAIVIGTVGMAALGALVIYGYVKPSTH